MSLMSWSKHGKNDFAEVCKNLARYRSEKILFGPSK